jgi:hypothetical protein
MSGADIVVYKWNAAHFAKRALKGTMPSVGEHSNVSSVEVVVDINNNNDNNDS